MAAALALILLVLFQVAGACECESGPIECYKTRGACIDGGAPPSHVFDDGDSSNCLGLNNPLYRCSDEPNYCRLSETCEVDIVIKRCDISTYFLCCDTPELCRQQIGFQFSANDAQYVCALFSKPFYHPIDEPRVIRMTSTCIPIEGGGAHQDPHFDGLDGTPFDFDGVVGNIYNIISDNSLSLNAEFVKRLDGIYMGRVGLRTPTTWVIFDPSYGAFHNGTLSTHGGIFPLDGGASFTVDHIDERPRMVFSSPEWTIKIRASVEKKRMDEAYSNIEVFNHVFTNPHGVLGRTARENGTETDSPLQEEDYRIHDGIVGVDFRHSQFQKN